MSGSANPIQMRQNMRPNGQAARWGTRPQNAQPIFNPFQGPGIAQRIANRQPVQPVQPVNGLLNTDYAEPPP